MSFNKFETLVFLIYLFNINQVIFIRDVTVRNGERLKILASGTTKLNNLNLHNVLYVFQK